MREKPIPTWAAILILVAVMIAGAFVLLGTVDAIHSDKEADCQATYGEEADWLGDVRDDGSFVRVCELPNGTLKAAPTGASK